MSARSSINVEIFTRLINQLYFLLFFVKIVIKHMKNTPPILVLVCTFRAPLPKIVIAAEAPKCLETPAVLLILGDRIKDKSRNSFHIKQ